MKVLFKIFFIALFLFFWRTIVYWENFVLGAVQKDLSLYIFLTVTMLSGSVLIGMNNKLITSKPIHNITFAWFVLMIIVAIYNKTTLSLFLKSLAWPIIFEVTYIYTKRNSKAEIFFRKYFFLLATMGLFFMFEKFIFSNFAGSSSLIFFFILPMPFLLRTNDRNKQYLLFFAMASMAILSSKRSIILAIAMFLLIWGLFNMIKKKKVLQSICLLFILAGVILYSFHYFGFLSESRLVTKMEKEDITNGRERIYDITILMIDRSSYDHKILGNGHNAVKQDSPMDISAHNEWLEITYDYGFIATTLYMCLWIIMLYNWYRLYKAQSPYFIPYSLMICIWAVMSMVSQLILYVSYVLYLFMFLAYVEGQRDKAMYQKLRSKKSICKS